MIDTSRSAFIIVAITDNGPQSLRCNRKETADAIATFIREHYADVRVFMDHPLIGQFDEGA